MTNLRYGRHSSYQGNLLYLLQNIPEKTTQIYLAAPVSSSSSNKSSSTNLKIDVWSQEIQKQAASLMTKEEKSLYIHAPVNCFLTNLPSDRVTKYTGRVLSDIMANIHSLPSAIVLHFGTARSDLATALTHTVINVQNLLNSKLFQTRGDKWASRIEHKLLLEVSANIKHVGSRWTDIEFIFQEVKAIEGTWIGLCLDTAHLFAAGMCDFFPSSIDAMFNWLEERTIKIGCIHLNDSKVQFGASVDRHANLGEGYIWPKANVNSFANLSYFLSACAERNLDVILETPNAGIVQDLQILESIAEQINPSVADSEIPTFHIEI